MSSDHEVRSLKLNKLKKLYEEGNMDLVIPEATKLFQEYSSGIAYNILALAHKRQGKYEDAIELYEKILVDNPKNPVFLYNLGNIHFDMGRRREAEEYYRKSLAIEPNQVDASISLGNLLVSNAKLDDALLIFKRLVNDFTGLTPAQLSDINYRIADIYIKKGPSGINKAIKYYGLSDQPLSSANRLELIYKSKDKSTFSQEAQKINVLGEANPLLATLQTHASIRYGIPDGNLFCRKPFKYIYQSRLKAEEGFNEDLVSKLLHVAKRISLTPQPLLNNGEQSAGNLLISNDLSVQRIKNIIINRINQYRNQHKNSNAGFIKNWPTNTILFGWIIKLKQGGNLDSHIHKQGWLSGSLYLEVPKVPGSSQGNIIFDLDGDNYPTNGKSFPQRELNIEKGDIALFPSSIFHKTVPFDSPEHRVTLAFDLKPVFS